MNHPVLIAMHDAAIADTRKADTLNDDLDAAFGRDVAVLVVDMSGFPRITPEQNIGAALLAVRRLQIAADTAIEEHGCERLSSTPTTPSRSSRRRKLPRPFGELPMGRFLSGGRLYRPSRFLAAHRHLSPDKTASPPGGLG